MAKAIFSEPIRTLVMQRSAHCCEYCKSQDRFSPVYFTIDHIIPLVLGGASDLDNLAYACMLCNRLKWGKIKAFDSVTNTLVFLYNPRLDIWENHFQWSEDFLEVIGMSSIGRATVAALQLNREKLVHYRKEMIEIGCHPPSFESQY
jgi:hypothetical protein